MIRALWLYGESNCVIPMSLNMFLSCRSHRAGFQSIVFVVSCFTISGMHNLKSQACASCARAVHMSVSAIIEFHIFLCAAI